MTALRSNFALSTFVVLTGIMLPIALSFWFIGTSNATALQAFAAGCALSSASLGTTFTILKTSALDKTRLGIVLTSTAMLDDVVGLVLAQVITNLGGSTGEGLSAAIIVRPIFLSIGYAAAIPLILYLSMKLRAGVNLVSLKAKSSVTIFTRSQAEFACYTTLLVGAVTSATYAGTSVPFAAYLTGILTSSSREHIRNPDKAQETPQTNEAGDTHPGNEEPVPLPTEDTNDSWEMVGVTPGAEENPALIVQATNSASGLGQNRSNLDSENPSRSFKTVSTQIDYESHAGRSASMYENYYGIVVSRLLKGFFFVRILFPSL